MNDAEPLTMAINECRVAVVSALRPNDNSNILYVDSLSTLYTASLMTAT